MKVFNSGVTIRLESQTELCAIHEALEKYVIAFETATNLGGYHNTRRTLQSKRGGSLAWCSGL